MPLAARVSDAVVNGTITGSSPNVFIGKIPAAAAVLPGSATVFINNKPAARLGDTTANGGVISSGMPSVIIGD